MTINLKADPLIEQELPKLQQICLRLAQKGVIPTLAVIMVGENPASQIYVRNKVRLCEKVGAKAKVILFPASISESELKKEITSINQDPEVSGLIIQLPLPSHLNSTHLLSAISIEKDVDCLNPFNIKNFYSKFDAQSLIPCTPKGIIKLLNFYKISIAQKNIVIVGRSNIVGKPLALMLQNLDATVTVCHSKTLHLKDFTRAADIVITAIGMPELFDETYFNSSKNQTVIDVGISKKSDGTTCGDVNFSKVSPVVAAISPVPGGVGKLTVLSLIENVILAAEKVKK